MEFNGGMYKWVVNKRRVFRYYTKPKNPRSPNFRLFSFLGEGNKRLKIQILYSQSQQKIVAFHRHGFTLERRGE